MRHTKTLIVIVGPTAVGKTDVAIQVANKFKTEIISADSRQFYKELNVGTAKPSSTQLRAVKHHFVDNLSIQDKYSAGHFEKDAIILLDEVFKWHDQIVMVGGSGMYIKAVCEGFDDMPAISEDIRKRLNYELKEKGLGVLTERLKKLDSDYYDLVDLNNHQRVVRALEVIESTKKPFSFFLKNSKPQNRNFNLVKIGLELEREEIYNRINIRLDEMIKNGLFEEAASLKGYRDRYALQTVGYTEIFSYLDGDYDYEEAIRLLKRNSRRYAKRQMTWFKKDKSVKWFDPNNQHQIIAYVTEQLKQD
ncbi:MAG: tRNA (adenosine(37)-N6)-dimethylallyltransferase MiaA [Cyclobacteriaceae bacterium]